MVYEFVNFVDDVLGNVDVADVWERHREGLTRLIAECEFIVTDYGTMYPSKGREVILLNRGFAISDKDGHDSWYHIAGGYKLKA